MSCADTPTPFLSAFPRTHQNWSGCLLIPPSSDQDTTKETCTNIKLSSSNESVFDMTTFTLLHSEVTLSLICRFFK